MISIDPHVIQIAVIDRIQEMEDQGRLDAFLPDGEYGYNCEAVFGVGTHEIAAVHFDRKNAGRIRLLQLTDGTFLSGDPDAHMAALPLLPAVTYH